MGCARKRAKFGVSGNPDAALHAELGPARSAKPAIILRAAGQRTVRGDDRVPSCPAHAQQRLTWLAKVLKPGACEVIKVYPIAKSLIKPPVYPHPRSPALRSHRDSVPAR